MASRQNVSNSDRELRQKEHFDYGVFHRTGEKVPLERKHSDMTTQPHVAKVTGELNGLLFEIDEALDDLGDVSSCTVEELRRSHDEMRSYRRSLARVSSELCSLLGEEYPDDLDNKVKLALAESKKHVTFMKTELAMKESAAGEAFDAECILAAKMKKQQLNERKFAFDTIVSEISTLTSKLRKCYDIDYDEDEMDSSIVIRRKEETASYASDLGRVKTLVDRLLTYTDVMFEDKEEEINRQYVNMMDVSEMKVAFESKLRIDLEKYDLTDQKLKLSTMVKVDIGKFNGSLEKGMDFYTFKSKFLKAYANYPKTLLVEYLTNNHLQGRAKECVGTLDCIENIWTRLSDHFGNTEEMLKYRFTKVRQLGQMKNQKTYEAKNIISKT